MGSSGSKTDPNTEIAAHPRLGNVTLLTVSNTNSNDTTNPNDYTQHLIYDVPVHSEKEVQDWLSAKRKIENTETNEVIFLPSKHIFEKGGLCGSSGTLKRFWMLQLTFDSYMYVLQNEISNRMGIERPFLEAEMWYLLFNMLRAGKEYQKHNRKIGDLQPANIVINQDGQIKIVSQDSWPGIVDNFQRIIESPKDKVLLGRFLYSNYHSTFSNTAPEQFAHYASKNQEYPKGVDPSAAEVFSIGLTLLEAGTLSDCQEATSNEQKLQSLLASLRKNYGLILSNTIESMLLLNPKDRPTCGALHAILSPFEDNILNIEDFQFDPRVSSQSLARYKSQNPGRLGSWTLEKIMRTKLQGSIPVVSYTQPAQYAMPGQYSMHAPTTSAVVRGYGQSVPYRGTEVSYKFPS